MSSSADTSARLDELESRLAFQDDLIEQLNEVIVRQDRDVLALLARVRELEAKLNDLAAAAAAPGGSPEQEAPPHY
jgi:SlyX protein